MDREIHYRAAFAAWASQVVRLRRTRELALETHVLDETESRTAETETAYRVARNRLAEEIAAAGISGPP